MTTRRTYHQYCGLAAALDTLGERWTLLIIRELMMRPRRYGELLADLPGLGTNLLAERLKFLTAEGIIRQRGLGGASSRQAYELTETGQELRPVVVGLARWGIDFVGDLSSEDAVRPSWGFLAVEAMIDPEKVGNIDEEYEFRVDDEVFHIEVRDGEARALAGPAENPAMTATTDAASFVQIGAGKMGPMAAMVTGKLVLEGDIDVVLRSCDLLGLDPGPVGAAAATGTAR